jgi:hypothetical protein
MVGIIVGTAAAIALECVNGLLFFLVPPLIVIAPLCLTIPLTNAATGGRGKNLPPEIDR